MTESGELIAGRYRLVNRIAVGGMGVVWEGWDELLARRVAVKQVLIQPGLSEADALLARHRVIREARITARLHHPHAVTIYDVVDDGEYPCLIMQFVPSDSLNGLLRQRGTLPPARVRRIGADLASALQAAHAAGIVHRDVKPGNILITADGSAKLTDFGISHAAGDVTLTSTGMVSGTPAYLAPEVARGGTSDYSADVFSLGATLYASMEGTPPFGLDPNPMAILHRVASGQLIPPKQSGELTPLLMQMLASDPADRPSMAEVSRTLTLPAVAPPAVSHPAVSTPAVSSPAMPSPEGHREKETAAQTVPVSRAELAAADPAEPRALTALLAAAPARSPETDTPGRRRSTLALVAVAAVVLISALTAGLFLINSGDDGQGPVAATSAPTQAAPTSESSVPDVSSAPVTASGDGSQTTAPTSAADQATALVAAVSGYYALMPGNTDAGWSRLTPAFQSGIAQNREYYNSFWGGVESVVATDVAASGPDTVEATITYTFSDGSVSVERTEYELVKEGAEFKIDNSSVLTSQSG